MKPSIAKNIFEEIRDRPYRVSESPEDRAQNCYFKSLELIEKLSVLGYGVRGRTGEINWRDLNLPSEILSLYKPEFSDTHFYVEIYKDGQWQILDPSWDSGMAHLNVPLSTWEGPNRPGFKITKLYDTAQQESHFIFWNNANNVKKYFDNATPFLKALNKWLLEQRKEF